MTSPALAALLDAQRLFETTGETTHAEKQNLYKGLLHLTAMIEDILARMDGLEQQIAELKQSGAQSPSLSP